MVHIVKLPEPEELLQAKREGLSDYNDMTMPVKEAVKARLFQEQRGLCAYCMRRIYLDSMQIEHYIPQHDPDGTPNTAMSIVYRNMLGVCSGGKKLAVCGKQDLTCDQHRGNTPLKIDPLVLASVQAIRYSVDGTIYSDDPVIDRDLDVVLNLNCPAAKLKLNRKSAMDAFRYSLKRKYGTRNINKTEWKKIRDFYDEGKSGIRNEYAGMFIEFLDRKLK